MRTVILVFSLVFAICSCTLKQGQEEEIQKVLSVINNNIGWAKNKDTTLSYSTMTRTEDLLIIEPDSDGITRGFKNFKKKSEATFLQPEFQAVRYELKNPQVYLSESGTCAWFFTYLDDINTWKGGDCSWRNIRWTGVLEKREGQWEIVQMHFSFPSQ
jgi:hypothetical protein